MARSRPPPLTRASTYPRHCAPTQAGKSRSEAPRPWPLNGSPHGADPGSISRAGRAAQPTVVTAKGLGEVIAKREAQHNSSRPCVEPTFRSAGRTASSASSTTVPEACTRMQAVAGGRAGRAGRVRWPRPVRRAVATLFPRAARLSCSCSCQVLCIAWNLVGQATAPRARL